jgi:hypothetical protein
MRTLKIGLIGLVTLIFAGQASAQDAPSRKTGKKAPANAVREQAAARSSEEAAVTARANAADPGNNNRGLPDWARAALPAPSRK